MSGHPALQSHIPSDWPPRLIPPGREHISFLVYSGPLEDSDAQEMPDHAQANEQEYEGVLRPEVGKYQGQ